MREEMVASTSEFAPSPLHFCVTSTTYSILLFGMSALLCPLFPPLLECLLFTDVDPECLGLFDAQLGVAWSRRRRLAVSWWGQGARIGGIGDNMRDVPAESLADDLRHLVFGEGPLRREMHNGGQLASRVREVIAHSGDVDDVGGESDSKVIH